MKDTRILVTGAAGFIGSHLVDALVNGGYVVNGADDLSGGRLDNINSKSRFFQIDLCRQEKVEKYIERVRPQIIFHLAADAAEARSNFVPISSIQRNLGAYVNVLVPAINNGLRKVILASSISIYGSQRPPFAENMASKPQDIYGIAKSAMEQTTRVLSKIHGFKYVILRPHNVYGPRQSLTDPYRNVVAIFINRLLSKKPFFIYGDGQQKRAFTYIDDLVPYVVKSAFSKIAEGEIINLGPLQEYSINRLAKMVLREFFIQQKIPLVYRPKYLPARPEEVKHAWCLVAKAEKILGYKARTQLPEGLAKTILWAKKQGPGQFQYIKRPEIRNKKFPFAWQKQLL